MFLRIGWLTRKITLTGTITLITMKTTTLITMRATTGTLDGGDYTDGDNIVIALTATISLTVTLDSDEDITLDGDDYT